MLTGVPALIPSCLVPNDCFPAFSANLMWLDHPQWNVSLHISLAKFKFIVPYLENPLLSICPSPSSKDSINTLHWFLDKSHTKLGIFLFKV